jgi:indoleamine 2,3-dioxygenase
MEARCAAIIPVMLKAIDAARIGDSSVVEACLLAYAQCALDLGILLERMYEECDPYVFYYQIRPFLAGSKNMEVAGLPKGVFYDEGNGRGEWRKYSGGSNAQSSLIQFLDAVLSVEHGATGELKGKPVKGGGGFLQV